MLMVDLWPGTVHLWLIDLDQPSSQFESLSADEGLRAAAFRFEPPRRRFISGRGVLRQILGGYLGEPPEALCFSYGAQGKPDLRSRIQFNLAHSGAWMLLAVAGTEPLGVDLEEIRPVPHLEAIAAPYLSTAEAKRLQAVPEPERPEAFLKAWTRMEALTKLDGRGVSKSHLHPSPQAHVQDLKPQPGLVGALATNRPVEVVLRTPF